MPNHNEKDLQVFTDLVETIRRLRAPDGCPWDRAQTHLSLRPHLLEETYEVLEVLDQISSSEKLGDPRLRNHFQEELGDLLMQVLIHSELAHEEGAFSAADVAKGLNEKLIRRHPHVFGEQKADSAEDALSKWEAEKAKEKKGKETTLLSGIQKSLPALQRTKKVIEKVSGVGFQWPDLKGPLEKVEEELSELKKELASLEANPLSSEPLQRRIEAELGDLLFCVCNVAHFLKINPEDALRGTVNRFQTRFEYVEKRILDQGKALKATPLSEMDQFWKAAKIRESVEVWALTGGVASGKSSVAQIFQEYGIPVIDADQISRQVSQKDGPAYSQILERFGTTDRENLREKVFSDPQARKDLEAILHPHIRQRSEEEILKLASQHRIVIYEASLIAETGRHRDFSTVVVVEAPREARIKRLMARNQFSQDLAEKIIAAQASEETLRRIATFTIQNSGEKASLKDQIQSILIQRGWIKKPSERPESK